jgi:hypothetical protein
LFPCVPAALLETSVMFPGLAAIAPVATNSDASSTIDASARQSAHFL